MFTDKSASRISIFLYEDFLKPSLTANPLPFCDSFSYLKLLYLVKLFLHIDSVLSVELLLITINSNLIRLVFDQA